MRLVFENTELLSMREASRVLGVSRMTLHRWIATGKIMAIRVGHQRAIHTEEIERMNKG